MTLKEYYKAAALGRKKKGKGSKNFWRKVDNHPCFCMYMYSGKEYFGLWFWGFCPQF